jgi:hypothetical protein
MSEYTDRALARLGDRNPFDVLADTPSRLEDAFWELGEKRLDSSYAEGKWPARSIFAHLADTEIVYAFRIRQALAADHPTVQPMDQDAWARRYGNADVALALELFRALRYWNLAVLRTLTDEELARPMLHPERGEEAIALVIGLMAGHDLGHLEQLRTIAAT